MSSDIVPERDPALIAGPTAAQWDGRSRIALAGAVVVLPVAVIGVALGASPGLAYTLAFCGLFVGAFIAWILLGQASLHAMRAEMTAGYSTVIDAGGYALRHPRTGALQRAADVPPPLEAPGRRSFLLDMLRRGASGRE